MEQYIVSLPVQIVLLSCLALVFAGTLLLAARPRWVERFLLVCACALTVYVAQETYRHYTSPPSNFSHYYLGAKYGIGYLDFYELILAGSGRPLLDYRDLKGTPGFGLANHSLQQKRAYYLRLLAEFDVRHDPRAGTEVLQRLCIHGDLFRRHGQRLLADAGFTAERQRQLAADVRKADINVRDCGFNGSPFYVLLRQLDPFLHLPLSIHSFRFSALLELVLLALSSLLLARAFHLGLPGLLLLFLLVLSSWDFINWSLSGQPGMIWFFPLAASLYLLTRERFLHAGLACSVAILLKVFPGVILLPAIVSLAARKAGREPFRRGGREVNLLAAAAAAVLVLALAAQTQADWGDWFEKIRRQFASGAFLAPNDICFYKSWHHAGLDIPGSEQLVTGLVWAARALLLVFLLAVVGRRPDGTTLALGGVAALAMMPWISTEFLQYYTFPHALLLAILYRERRGFFYVLMPLLLINQALVDYPHPIYVRNIGSLVWLKTLYYLAAPLLFLYFLFRRPRRPAGVPG